ncbi:unnamed protein product [Hermetia illucens]|nr:unnamed protein product [Hermetia illucens]
MKRVASRTLKYFYGPIEGTPFALALALPDKYGSHELVSHQEIRHSRSNVLLFVNVHDRRIVAVMLIYVSTYMQSTKESRATRLDIT